MDADEVARRRARRLRLEAKMAGTVDLASVPPPPKPADRRPPQTQAEREARTARLRAMERAAEGLPPLAVPVADPPLPPAPPEPPLPVGIRLGTDVETGRPVILPDSSRAKGLYLIGAQGKGKSSLIEDLILQDIAAGHGLCLVDPHPDLIPHVLGRIPPHREQDVVVLNVNDLDRPFGLNLMACEHPDDLALFHKTVERMYRVFERLWGEEGENSWGAQLEEVITACIHTLVKNREMTLVEMPLLLEDAGFRTQMLAALRGPEDETTRRFWKRYSALSPGAQANYAGSAMRRFSRFLQEPVVRGIVGQRRSSVDFGRCMDEGRIVLVQLDGENQRLTALIGSIIVGLVYQAAFDRPEHRRRLFALYADEVSYFATKDFERIISRTRKFGLAPTIAHQRRSQLGGRSHPLHDATLGMGSYVVFGVQDEDARDLVPNLDAHYSTANRTLELDPLRHIRTKGHTDPLVLRRYNELNRLLTELKMMWDTWQHGYYPPSIAYRERGLTPNGRMDDLTERMREYLFDAMQGNDRPELFDLMRDMAPDQKQHLADILTEIGHALARRPLTMTGDQGTAKERLRSELSNLKRYEAVVRVDVHGRTTTHRITTAPYHPIHPSAETRYRIERLLRHSRARFPERGDVEQDILRRRRAAPPPLQTVVREDQESTGPRASVPQNTERDTDHWVQDGMVDETPDVRRKRRVMDDED